ncbi:MAG: hypothetical protein WD603_00175 [Patescibacteria group bacterium]
MTATAPPDVIVVSAQELEKWGCPHCGFQSGQSLASTGGGTCWICGECGRFSIVLAEGLTESPIEIDEGIIKVGGNAHGPTLQEHPRKGIPKHGTPDERPDQDGGEHFRVRGIGRDRTPGCFVCGGEEELYHNIAAFVQCKASGERVVAMFETGVRLDYRDFEPNRVQVKVGACDTHRPNLDRLYELTGDGVINAERIETARSC